MKMIYGNMPVKKINITQYDVSTNDATVVASDLQAGVSCYARGQKIIGTGKCFEFAEYGTIMVNFPIETPFDINVMEIASIAYPIKTLIALRNIKNIDFSTTQELATVVVDGMEYPITAIIQDGFITLSCDKDLDLEIFYGKDRYI